MAAVAAVTAAVAAAGSKNTQVRRGGCFCRRIVEMSKDVSNCVFHAFDTSFLLGVMYQIGFLLDLIHIFLPEKHLPMYQNRVFLNLIHKIITEKPLSMYQFGFFMDLIHRQLHFVCIKSGFFAI